MDAERRYTPAPSAAPVTLRSDTKGPRVEGYAALFYSASDPGSEYHFSGLWDDFVERIMPGAFDRAIREDDVRGLFNHNPDFILGRNKAGTMRLKADAKGLWYSIDMPAHALAGVVLESVSRGDVSGSSFAFLADDVQYREQKQPLGDVLVIREVHSVTLVDVSPVVYPAYQSTTAGAVRAEDLTPAWWPGYAAWKEEAGGVGADPGLKARLARIRARAAEVSKGTDAGLAGKLAAYRYRARAVQVVA
jgi:HK97 family phage prohead protease